MTKDVINKLTPAQAELLPKYRDKWVEIGLSCAPFEKGRAEAAVRKAYRCAGMKEPRIFIHLDSPLRGAVGAAIVAKLPKAVRGQVRGQVRDQVRGQVWDQVGGQVWDQVGGQVRDQVGGQVWDQVGGQVRDQVGGQVRDQVRGQVWDQVRDQVWGQVRGQVRDQVGGQVRDQVRGQVWDQVRGQVWLACYGQHDADWLSFYDFFREACGLAVCEKLEGLNEVARECGWWWPFADAVIITPKAKVLHRDDRGRLHCEDGPALLYPDGWGIWAIHGVRVTQQVVEQPKTIPVAQIEAEKNAEVKRVMIDRYGQARFLVDAGAKQIHADDFGVLYRKEIPDDEPLVMVKVVNSTAEPDGTFKDYFLRVPPTITTARAAVAWTFEMDAAEFEPAIQT